MAVQGELYFLMMMHMHFLCLLAAKKARHLPLRPGCALLSCLLSSAYSLFALYPHLPLQNGLITLCSLLTACVCAFGKQGFSAALPMGISGLAFGGVCHFLEGRGVPPWGCLAACTLLCLLMKNKKAAETASLFICYRGNCCRLPGFFDTGSSLHHPLLSLPVILAPADKLRPLLPPGFRADDIATLPPGFVPVPVETVNGKSLMMAFHPDTLLLLPGRQPIDALIAVTPRPLPRAILPCTLQPKEVHCPWRKRTGNAPPPSVNG